MNSVVNFKSEFIYLHKCSDSRPGQSGVLSPLCPESPARCAVIPGDPGVATSRLVSPQQAHQQGQQGEQV